MANYTITTSTVVADATATKASGTAGAAIAAGDPVYKDATDDNKLKLSVATSAAAAAAVGIALHAAAVGQPVQYIASGDLTLTITVGSTVGDDVVVSATAGKMAPQADLVAGNFPTRLGWLITATKLRVSIDASGIAKA